MSNYITSRCGRHAAGWSTQDLLAVLENELEAVAPKILDRCKNILTKCDTISYAPTSSASDVLGDIHLSEQLIHELEKELK